MKKSLATVAAALLLGTGGGMAMAQTTHGTGMSSTNGPGMSNDAAMPQQNGTAEQGGMVSGSRTNMASGSLTARDKQFLRQHARTGAYERALSEAAGRKASSQQVRQFAQQEISDHTALHQEAQQIAEQNNVTLPAQPTRSEQNRVNHLKALNGNAFDQAYLRDMQSVSRMDMNRLRKEASTTRNQEMRQFAQNAENVDRTYESRARTLQTARNETGSTAGTGVSSDMGSGGATGDANGGTPTGR